VGAGRPQGFEAGPTVFGATTGHGVGEDRDSHALAQGVHGGLINADRDLETADEQLADLELAEGLDQPRSAEGGEGRLPEDRPRLAGGQQQIRMGRAQLGGDLFGEEHGDSQQLGGRGGQEAAT